MDGFANGMDFDFDHTEMDFSDLPEVPDNYLGKCPHCGATVKYGQYGAYCPAKCGMFLGKAFGVMLTKAEVKHLLNNETIFVKSIRSKKDKVFDAYLKPEGIEHFSYRSRDGEEKEGYQFRFKMTFPKKKKEE